MSVTTNPAANRIYQQFSTEFIKALETSAPPVSRKFSMEVPSSSKSTLHEWLQDEAQVREWKGARILNQMGTLGWEVFNRDWEISWSFRKQQIDDDLAGLVALAIQRARGYAAKWIRHEDTLIATTVQAGVSKPCYDGQNFFSATHPTDPLGIVSGTYSNYFTAKPFNHQNLMFGLQKLMSIKLPDGSPWVGPGSKVKVVHEVSNMFTVGQALKDGFLTPAVAFALSSASGPSSNPLVGAAEPVLNPYMNNEPGVWYLAAEVDGMSPIMFQRRQDVESDEIGPGSQLFFERKEIRIGQDARHEASYTQPALMIRFEPT